MKLPSITKRQQEILRLIYNFRFLTRLHLQTIFNHKDYKRINIWLKDLVNKEYIGRIYEKTADTLSDPAIYYMAKNGIVFLRKLTPLDETGKKLLKRLRREKDKSLQFIKHSLFLMELYCLCLRYGQEAHRTITFYTKIDMENHTILGDLLPDAYVKIKDRHRKAKRYLIEVFKEGVPRFAIRYRIKKYLSYYQDETWQQNVNRPFPTILFITPDDKKYYKYVQILTRRVFDEEGMDFDTLTTIIATQDNIKIFGLDDLLWMRMKEE